MQCDSSYVENAVSRETLDDLQRYVDHLLIWTDRINLISPSTVAAVWHRHIADSIQLQPLIPDHSAHVVDFGTGGGLPGVVLAILNKSRKFTFVESDKRKSVFLRQCIGVLELDADVVTARVENLAPLAADVITARGFTALDRLLALAECHLAPDGVGIFPKGRNAAAEIDVARKSWAFHMESHQSISDPEARLLLIKDINRAG